MTPSLYDVALDRAARVIRDWQKPGTLTLTCYRCTRVAAFMVASRELASKAASDAGWVQRGGRSICPRCNA